MSAAAGSRRATSENLGIEHTRDEDPRSCAVGGYREAQVGIQGRISDVSARSRSRHECDTRAQIRCGPRR